MNRECKRLLRDKSKGAAARLLILAKRRGDEFLEVVALARLGDPESWERIVEVAPSLTEAQLAVLDEALSGWPWNVRVAPAEWAVPKVLPVMRIVRVLVLKHCLLDDKCAKYLSDSKALANLRLLDLWSNRISDEGVKHLADSETFGCLQYLDLGFNDFGNDGAKYLVKSKNFAGLQRLCLWANAISDTIIGELRTLLTERGVEVII